MLSKIITDFASAFDVLGLIVLMVGALHLAAALLTGRGIGGRGLILVVAGILICGFGTWHAVSPDHSSAERRNLSHGG